MLTDIQAAWRSLRGAPGFTALAVATLTVGATLVVTLLSVVNAYLIRSQPYPEVDRLYRVEYAAPGQDAPDGLERLDWAALDSSIEHLVAWDLDVFYLLGDEYPENAPGAWVTPGFVRAIGITAALGRSFDAADFARTAPPVAIISHRLWQSRYGGDPDVIGRRVSAYVSDRPNEPEAFTIVGVLPERFWHFNAYTEVMAPLKAPTYPYMVRLRPGVDPGVAAMQIGALVRASTPTLASNWRPALISQQESYVAALRPVLGGVSAGVGLVFLIATANVAVLMLLRGRQRQKDLAIHTALGATSGRLARRLVYEGAILGLTSTVAGIIASRAVMQQAGPLVERVLARRVPGGPDAFALDPTVVGLATLLGCGVTLLATLAPLLSVDRSDPAAAFLRSDRTATETVAMRRTRSALMGLEVAASVALVSAAALITTSLLAMLRVDFGMTPTHVYTASVGLRQQSYPDASTRARFYERLLLRLDEIEGGPVVAIGDWWPLQSGPTREIVGATGITSTAGVIGVAGDYFAALGITLREGRRLQASDREASVPVVILSESLARRLAPQGSAVGQQVTLRQDADQASPRLLEALVVGVVSDVRQTHGDTDLLDAYVPLLQQAGRFAYLYVRGSEPRDWNAPLRAAVAWVDREVALGSARAFAAALDDERTRPRFLAWLLVACAVFATTLAVVGIGAVVAYSARQRRREIAVRLALGSTPREVTALFVRQTVVVLLGGVAAGMGVALAMGQVLQSQLYGVGAADLRWTARSAALLIAVGLAAAWWPSYRATAVNPARLLSEN